MGMAERQKLIRWLGYLSEFAEDNQIEFIITAFYRTPEEQNKLFREGKSKCDGYKVKSRHQLWRAVDVAVVVNDEIIWEGEEYKQLGEHWESLGGVWGGRWKDPAGDLYHFEV